MLVGPYVLGRAVPRSDAEAALPRLGVEGAQALGLVAVDAAADTVAGCLRWLRMIAIDDAMNTVE